MVEVLLAIIAACLLFGGAAVLGFLETAFWLILFLAVVAAVVAATIAVVRFAAASVASVIENVQGAYRSPDARRRGEGAAPEQSPQSPVLDLRGPRPGHLIDYGNLPDFMTNTRNNPPRMIAPPRS